MKMRLLFKRARRCTRERGAADRGGCERVIFPGAQSRAWLRSMRENEMSYSAEHDCAKKQGTERRHRGYRTTHMQGEGDGCRGRGRDHIVAHGPLIAAPGTTMSWAAPSGGPPHAR